MNIVKILFTLVASFLFMGCDKDESNVKLTSDDLYQTIWEGSFVSYGSENTPEVTQTFVVEFISMTEGKCVLQDFHEIQVFEYTIKDSVVSFKGSYAMQGDWYIVDSSSEQITLQAYLPYKTVLTLKRIYY